MSIINAVTIAINMSELSNSINQLNSLKNSLENRKMDIEFEISKGGVPASLADGAKELTAIGTDLLNLVDRTSTIMQNAKNEFAKADQSSGELFTGEKKM